MFAQETLRDADVRIGKIRRVRDGRLLVLASLLQVTAIKRTVDRLLALGPAADGTDVSADTRAVTPGPPCFTDSAEYSFDTFIVSSGIDATSGSIPQTRTRIG